MMKSKLMILALILGFSLLVVPIVSASNIAFPTGMIDRYNKVDVNDWNRSIINKNMEVHLELDIMGDHYNPEDGINYWYISKTGGSLPYYQQIYMNRFTLAKPKIQYIL